jgi:tetratricopeptide (TPR) repeat protein
MFRKNYLTFCLALFLLLAGSLTALSQTAPVSGKVELKKADGTSVPVDGAMVEVYRTDVKSKLPSAKTNKRGEFVFAGLPLGATFVLAVSAPVAAPGYYPNVRAGSEKILISLTEGDGKRWTEEEIRQAVSGAAATGSAAQQPTAESKKAEAERLKLIAENEAQKKKIETENASVTKSLADGNAAFNSKNYDLAITKYDEGIAANPDYAGSASVLLNNKGVALKNRAIDNYNKAIKSTDAAVKTEALGKVKQDLEAALTGYIALQ